MTERNPLTAVRVRLAGLASADLLWRVPELTPTDAAGSDLAIALVSLAFGIGDVSLLETVSTWVLLGYVAGTVAPVAYPERLGLPVERLGFRYSFAFLTLSVAAAFEVIPAPATVSMLVVVLGIVLSGGVWYLLYLRHGLGWRLSPDDPRYRNVLDSFVPTSDTVPEMRENFERDGILGVVGVGLNRLAIGCLVAFPAMLSGVVTVVLLAAYPLPDVLILTWAGLSLVGSATGWNVQPTQRAYDLESRLYEGVAEATKSMKGLFLSVYLVGLSLGFVFLFGGTLTILGSINRSLVLPWVEPRITWGLLGVVLVLLASSAYGLWCCVRMIRRLPVFLRQDVRRFREQYGTTTAEPADDRPRPRPTVPTRPVGFVFLPVVAMTFVFVATPQLGVASVAFALCWPLLLALFGRCVVWTRRRKRDTIAYDGHYVITGMVLLPVAFESLAHSDTIGSAITTGQVSLTPLPDSVYVILLLVWLGYSADVMRRADAREDWRRYLKSAYFLGFAVGFGILTPFSGPLLRELYYVVVFVTGVAGVAFVLTATFEQ